MKPRRLIFPPMILPGEFSLGTITMNIPKDAPKPEEWMTSKDKSPKK